MDITKWMDYFLKSLQDLFGERVWFVGLQGSRGRGEETENSDIDVVVILDELTTADIDSYSKMLDKLSHRELICGFVSGRDELLNWETSDLFQFYHDTKPIKGSLDMLRPLIDDCAVDRAIKIGACNIYHGCVHNMIHEKNSEILKGLYKAASFTVQAVSYRQTGKYTSRLIDILDALEPDDRYIIETYINIKNGVEIKFAQMSEALFNWARKHINT